MTDSIKSIQHGLLVQSIQYSAWKHKSVVLQQLCAVKNNVLCGVMLQEAKQYLYLIQPFNVRYNIPGYVSGSPIVGFVYRIKLNNKIQQNLYHKQG